MSNKSKYVLHYKNLQLFLRKTIKVRLVSNAKDYKKYAKKPSFVSQKIFSENFVAIHKIRLVLTLNKSISVEFNILDLSKYLIYDFHYNYIQTKYKNCAKLLFADTDSLVYDVYEDFYKNNDLFDLREYPQDSKFFDPINKKIIGKMKNEFKGKIISEFVGLKSKMYSLIDVDNDENTKPARVNKKVRHKT